MKIYSVVFLLAKFDYFYDILVTHILHTWSPVGCKILYLYITYFVTCGLHNTVFIYIMHTLSPVGCTILYLSRYAYFVICGLHDTLFIYILYALPPVGCTILSLLSLRSFESLEYIRISQTFV